MLSLTQGFVVGLGMISAIGAQNAYLINKGIARNHPYTCATICFSADFVLISLGIFGGGLLLAQYPLLLATITWAGVIFLTVYGAQSLKSALTKQHSSLVQAISKQPRWKVALATAAVTLLNPHVYLDTVVILGSIGGQLDEENRIGFAVGCLLASLVWFYGLATLAIKLAPWLASTKAQRCLNLFVALVMFSIAAALAWQALTR